jgi:hypothetical protein
MDWTLSTYLEYKNWIDLIKDLVFFAGAYVFFKFLKNKKFTDVSEQIDKNLRFRRRIESELNDYVYKMYKRDIAIRFVHWGTSNNPFLWGVIRIRPVIWVVIWVSFQKRGC